MISFLSVFPPYRGGISTFSDYLYRHLSDHRVVNAYNFKTLYPDLLFPGKSQKREEEGESYAEPLLHSYNPLNWNRAARRIAKDQPDFLLYSHWHPFFSPAYSSVMKKLSVQSPSTRSVCIAHNILPHESFPFGKQLIRRMLNRTDKIVLLSGQTLGELHQLKVNIENRKLFHPVYTMQPTSRSRSELREAYGFQPGDRVLLFFGLIRKYKGLDLLIDALNQLDLEQLQIRPLIAGEFYDSKEDYIDRIRQDHRSLYTIVDRFVTDEELAEIFTLSDLLVLPYRSASQSGILANAIQFQLPVLVSDQPGLTEHIDHGKTGLIFESENVEALRSAIRQYIETIDTEKMRENLKQLKNELSWENFTGQLLGFLES
ncbi:MAG: glycosyltransferase [Balneolaceae bacterium]|nr:glycosyltransferase [Balneolaceae bacterium]